jgi:uncharacterized RDD family membrane protein YckC
MCSRPTRTSPKRTRRSDLPDPAQLNGVALPRRLGAGTVDAALAIGLFVALVLASRTVPALRLLAVIVPSLLYFVIAEHYYQATVGKWLFGLKVVTIDGERPELLAHIVRGMTRIPEAMMLMLPYLVIIPFSQRKQRFGDMITDTLVVRRADLDGR